MGLVRALKRPKFENFAKNISKNDGYTVYTVYHGYTVYYTVKQLYWALCQQTFLTSLLIFNICAEKAMLKIHLRRLKRVFDKAV